MKEREKLLQELIISLTERSEEWVFDQHVARNVVSGVELWIANIPILNLCVYKPHEIGFSLWGKIRLHKAINKCKLLNILKKQP